MPDQKPPTPRWREDFPIHWENDHYVTRRELAKFLTLGSGLLVLANAVLAAIGSRLRPHEGTSRRVARVDEVPVGGALQFRYPTQDDPCLLMHDQEGKLVAYSQVCTHLSCAVVREPGANQLYCPCHEGVFALEDGSPRAGPPTRPLPRIRLVERDGEVYATGVET